MAKSKTAIQPTRIENYPEWYQSVLKEADLSEPSGVRGCMVIKPWGYALWENIQRILDGQFKATGHQNAYFPLFVPLSYFEKESEHIEGFAKECAVVTHHRLEKNQEGRLVPAGELEEPLIVRPTSEMIIGHTMAKWIESYRDLPVLINQWCNVVRWEMRTRMFLRTTEFLWQEGHTVHASKEEAEIETKQMLNIYTDFARNILAIPVIPGIKSQSETFPGAVYTYTIEAMMQDRKALQSGTAHFLGQNFSRACGIEFQNVDGQREWGWTTSWGLTTRVVGALVMTHSDDDGLVLPPRIASAHLVIIPIVHTPELKEKILHYCNELAQRLRQMTYSGTPLKVIVDSRDMRGGEKSWSWIKKGVPLRLEIGPREVDSSQLNVARRNHPHKEHFLVSAAELPSRVVELLDEIQEDLYQKALHFRNTHTHVVDTKEAFYRFFADRGDPIEGGFVLAHWNGDPAVEEKVKQELNVTIRCIPFEEEREEGICIFTGQKSPGRVLFAKAY